MLKKLVILFLLILVPMPCFAGGDTALTILYTGETQATINPRRL